MTGLRSLSLPLSWLRVNMDVRRLLLPDEKNSDGLLSRKNERFVLPSRPLAACSRRGELPIFAGDVGRELVAICTAACQLSVKQRREQVPQFESAPGANTGVARDDSTHLVAVDIVQHDYRRIRAAGRGERIVSLL